MTPSPCRLRIGTSGYSYTEWIEAGFYPSGAASREMLPHYVRIFDITELNYTWYQMPKAPSLERMRKIVGPEFLFAAKLTRTMTHEIEPEKWRDQVARYRDGVAPLIQSGQLAAVLVQLPASFHRSNENRVYLADLLDALNGLPVALELRHASWAIQPVFDSLIQRRVTLVAVDEPPLPDLFPALDVVTNPDFFYVRFHGRNAAGWRSGNMQKQFDYDYSETELNEWIEKYIVPMAGRAKNGFLFFNNHVRAQAPGNARTLMRLLGAAGLMGERGVPSGYDMERQG